jgi:hypothetical protein
MTTGTGTVEPDPERWLVPLPRGVRPPIEVFVSGVPQSAGVDYDYEQRGDTGVLAFRRPLQREGRIGFWRWTLMFFSIAGTYRRDDSVDVRYTVDDEPRVVTGLAIVPPRGTGAAAPARSPTRR